MLLSPNRAEKSLLNFSEVIYIYILGSTVRDGEQVSRANERASEQDGRGRKETAVVDTMLLSKLVSG